MQTKCNSAHHRSCLVERERGITLEEGKGFGRKDERGREGGRGGETANTVVVTVEFIH